jgi:hypothetical protein
MSTGIVQVRLSGEHDDVTRLAALITAIPGVTATPAAVRANRTDPGMRGYLTVTINNSTGKDHGR